MTHLLCRYENSTNTFQVVAVSGMERLLFPGSSIEFRANPDDVLLVKDGYISAINADHILCKDLLLNNN